MKTRYSRAIIPRNTQKKDALLLIVLIILIVSFGFKIIFFTAVISDSMKPQFQRGDLILTQTIFKQPQPGDIVTFKAENVQLPVTHRVIKVNYDNIITKGDNNPLPDDYNTKEKNIMAKAIVIEGTPLVLKGMGSFFILDFSKEGKLYKFGDQFTFLQELFSVIRTWGYVITIIAFSALVMSMFGSKR